MKALMILILAALVSGCHFPQAKCSKDPDFFQQGTVYDCAAGKT